MIKKVVFHAVNWAIAGCIAVSLFMRCRLFGISYEYDELFTAVTTDPLLDFPWIYTHYLLADVHPPLYNLLLWGWNHLVPYGPEFWLRVPSWFFGIGALVCAWVLFPRYLGKSARLVFTALLSCNMYTMFYAQHARSYMFVLLLAVPYTFLFIDICRRMPRLPWRLGRSWLTFTLLSILLCWSHYFGALLVNVCLGYLALQMICYKQKMLALWVSWGVVWACFLPWLIPNLLAQTTFNRLGGNWVGDVRSLTEIPGVLAAFFFGNLVLGYVLMGTVMLLGMYCLWKKYRHTGGLLHARTLLALGSICVGAFIVVFLLSLKSYMFYERYFIVFLPAVYLMIALVIQQALRQHRVLVGILLVCFWGLTFMAFQRESKTFTNFPRFPIRLITQVYKDFFLGKEIMVIAVEAFPAQAMQAMFNFYPNRVYGLNVPVTELVSLDEAQRNEMLKRQDDAFVFMPNCEDSKLKYLLSTWHRSVGIHSRVANACMLKIF